MLSGSQLAAGLGQIPYLLASALQPALKDIIRWIRQKNIWVVVITIKLVSGG